MAKFRILSLDGGGAWALIEVMTLIDLYGADTRGHDVLKEFDLIAATSGGSIVLGGLAMNMTLQQLSDLFFNQERREQLFVKTEWWREPLNHLAHRFGIGPRYAAAAKLAGLKAILGPYGDRQLSALPDAIGPGRRQRKPHLVITAFHYDLNRGVFARSDQDSRCANFGPHRDFTLAEAIHASSNAPVNYFNAPAEIGDDRYWDGAIGGYNNPVHLAALEVVGNADRYETTIGEITAVSLGTGSVALPLGPTSGDANLVRPRPASTLTRDLAKLATSIVDDPPDAASFHAHILLGGALPRDEQHPVTTGPVVRLSPLLQPFPGTNGRPWDYPPGLDQTQFADLCKLDVDAIEPESVKLIECLRQAWHDDKARNQPIRANGKTLAAEIGHGLYSEAKQQLP
jgi:predicted acylesterase/phospholipase RssA